MLFIFESLELQLHVTRMFINRLTSSAQAGLVLHGVRHPHGRCGDTQDDDGLGSFAVSSLAGSEGFALSLASGTTAVPGPGAAESGVAK